MHGPKQQTRPIKARPIRHLRFERRRPSYTDNSARLYGDSDIEKSGLAPTVDFTNLTVIIGQTLPKYYTERFSLKIFSKYFLGDP